MFFVLSRAWDKEKFLSPHEESNLRPSDSAFRCSTTEPQRRYNERWLYFISNCMNKRLTEWMKTLSESKLECMNNQVIDKRLIDWLVIYWLFYRLIGWPWDWLTDRPLTYCFKLTDYWLTDWMTLLTDLVTVEKEGLEWSNIFNIVCFFFNAVLFFCLFFCFFLFCLVF